MTRDQAEKNAGMMTRAALVQWANARTWKAMGNPAAEADCAQRAAWYEERAEYWQAEADRCAEPPGAAGR